MSEYSKKILEIKYPEITCYNQHANLLAILSVQGNDYLPWFYNYYIQLQFANNINHPEIGARLDFENLLEWESCPFLYCQKIHREFVSSKWDDVLDFVFDSIGKGYYIYLTVDSYCINIYEAYQLFHFIHPLLIYGYDKTERLLYVADNCKDGKYSFETVSFEQFTDGYREATNYDEEYYLDSIVLVKYQNRNRFYNWNHEYQLDLRLIKNSIKDFLNAKGLVEHGMIPIEQWKRETLIYGAKCYEYIKNYIKNIDCYKYDHRTFFVLYEHKKVMKMRVNYLQENQYLKNQSANQSDFQTVEEMAASMHALWLKYGFTKKETTIQKILQKLEKMEQLEAVALNRLLSELSS